ncbi:MAG: hypothetical protein H7336_06820 [Bacteriovorax sp.]|nr:hypothetical protein [Bacteriovorax sp.]
MAVGTNRIWILILVSCVYSINSFAMNDRKNHSNDAIRILSNDCVSCTPVMAAGSPLEGNKSAQLVALVSSKAMSQADASFQSYLNVYCMNFTQLGGVSNFKQTLLDPMKATSGSEEGMNRYWLAAGCEPQLMGGTTSPLVHLAAENATERKSYLEALQKYYLEKNDKASFTKIINAKNSRGYTLLDYLNYLYVQKEFMAEEEKGINDLYKFLCDNGGVFSIYKKKCPPEYLKI